MKLLKVDTVEEARQKVRDMAEDMGIRTDYTELSAALGKALAEDIRAAEPVPAFPRSTVDGYAVCPSDTSGASESMPVFLEIAGEVCMGQKAPCMVRSGECVYVPTGGMIPEGAGAVVMEEYCELFSGSEAAVYQPVSQGANIIRAGGDMEAGTLVLKRGTRLRPQEIGVLAALGVTEVKVLRPWSVTIISTGDELVPPIKQPAPGQIRDINTYVLQAQALRQQMEVSGVHVLKDDRALLVNAARAAMTDSDIVVISGGSSQGRKDVTCSVVEELASEGAFTHGLALKPGKPTILGYDKPSHTLFAGLPGHPAAAMLVFELIIGHLWRTMSTGQTDAPITARLSMNVPAAPGRMTCQLVRLERDEAGELWAAPVFGRSGLISLLARADGYVLAGENQEGIRRGETAEVYRI